MGDVWAGGDNAMQYLLLIYDSEKEWAKMSQAEQGKMYGEYMEFTSDIKAKGNHLGGNQLQPIATATTVRVREREAADDRRAVCGDEGATRRVLHDRGEGSRRSDRDLQPDSVGARGIDRGAAARGTRAGCERISAATRDTLARCVVEHARRHRCDWWLAVSESPCLAPMLTASFRLA